MIPKGATTGGGLATVLVDRRLDEDDATDRQVLTLPRVGADVARDARSTVAARRSYIDAMPVWRCPHCATPQAEASRCWVCRRSTTSCVTCRHYRRAIARRPRPTAGSIRATPPVADTEVRACWVGDALPRRRRRGWSETASTGSRADGPSRSLGRRTARTFVPVEAVASRGRGRGGDGAALVARSYRSGVAPSGPGRTPSQRRRRTRRRTLPPAPGDRRIPGRGGCGAIPSRGRSAERAGPEGRSGWPGPPT